MSGFVRIVLLFVGMLLLGAAVVSAQEGKDPTALFNEASDLAEKGQFEEAVAIWEMVADVIPEKYRPVVQVNLGLAYKKLEKLPQAWYHLSRYLETQEQGDEEVEGWKSEVEGELRKTHAQLTIRCDPVDASVFLQGEGTAKPYPCPLVWWFKPGKRIIRVRKEGFEDKMEVLSVEPDRKEFVYSAKLTPKDQGKSVTEKPADAQTSKPDPPDPGPVEPGPGEIAPGQGTITRPATEPRSARKVAGWAMVGGGAAVVVGGFACHLAAYSRNENLKEQYPDGTEGSKVPPQAVEDYNSAYDEDVRPVSTAAWILYGAGGAAAVAGAVLLVLDAADGGKSTAHVAPLFAPEGAGIGVSIAW